MGGIFYFRKENCGYLRNLCAHGFFSLKVLAAHIYKHLIITIAGGDFMQNSILTLTEQRQSNDEPPISGIIQQAITTWLTKELYK